MQYVGISYSTGSQFDASWDRKQPYAFKLGQETVIKGWDQGVPGMRVGGRRLLVIPPDLGYGAQGRDPIAPNETLIFVVDLKKVG
jgi:peptidylprolyl isomerase